MRRLLSLTVLLVSALLLGCPAKLPEGATALDKIRIDKVERDGEGDEVDEDDVLDAMASDPTHKVLGLFRVWWQEYGIYDPAIVEKDLRRIERYYRARGYYEARVRAGRVVHTAEHEVRVQIVVEEGPAVVVARVVEIGIEVLPADVQARIREVWALPPGAIFDEADYHRSASEAERILTDSGYAYAAVRLGSEVDLVKHEAVVRVEFVPGPPCTFGGYTVEGLNELSEKHVRTIVDIDEGDPYSTRTIRDAQRALFDLGTFDTVLVTPDLSVPGRTVVPFKVSVTEAKLRRVKAGPGILIDPLRNDVHFLASWEHRNFLGGLRNFRVQVRPLLMIKPGFTSPETARPGFTTSAELRQPSFIEARTTGLVGGTTGILPDPVNDYRVWSTRGTLGLERRFGPLFTAGLYYRKGFEAPTPYGDSLLPPNVFEARIGYLEALATVDARDDVLSPHHGYYASASVQYAFASKGFYAGDFADVRVQPEFRFYGPLHKRVTLAFRFMAGFLLPRNYSPRDPERRTPTADDPSSYQDDTEGDTPLWRAFFSGGASSNRGYPVRQVGLRDCTREPDGRILERGADCSITVGGASVWEGSVELRFDLVGALSAVLFMDASDVSRAVFDLRLDRPHLSVGPGVRYFTPIGPIRLDFGWRVPGAQRLGAPLDPREEPREFVFGIRGPFALHLSIGEAF
jgi:outer membrane translocation and assembly module TamA